MVDKYIGDAIMAVFGAPAPRHQPEEIQADAIAALHAALEMHERLQQLNQQLAAQQLPLIKFGIGVHTGPLIGGTIGNRQRLSYSLFGDTVNIAARLESMTKQLPDDAPFRLLLSAETYQQTQEHFPVTLFQSGQLRGANRPYRCLYDHTYRPDLSGNCLASDCITRDCINRDCTTCC